MLPKVSIGDRSAQHRHLVPVYHLKLPRCKRADGYLDMQLLRNPRMTLYLRDGPLFDDETGEMDYHAGCWCQSLACRHVMQTSSLTLQGHQVPTRQASHVTLRICHILVRGSIGPKGRGAAAHRRAGAGGLDKAAAAASGMRSCCTQAAAAYVGSCSAGLSTLQQGRSPSEEGHGSQPRSLVTHVINTSMVPTILIPDATVFDDFLLSSMFQVECE